MPKANPPDVVGLDFGTTNSVAAVAANGTSELIALEAPCGPNPVFRSALCFWEEEAHIAAAAGPWAIEEYLACPEGSRFIQSFKSVVASRTFESATIFERRYRFEDLGRLFLTKLSARSGGVLGNGTRRLVIGRPVTFAGNRPDEALARDRYDAMFADFADEAYHVYEPLGAAFSFAARLEASATVLVADFGGGTSDFSVVNIDAAAGGKRCTPLGHAGIGIAGDTFDSRILEHLVLPLLGKGGQYRSFDKLLDIPAGWFADFTDWSRLALLRNRKALAELGNLRRAAVDPEPIGRMMAIIEQELGYRLYETVGDLKRQLSSAEQTVFRFNGAGLSIEQPVTRADFERWIAPDVAAIEAAVSRVLATSGIAADKIDRVFLTGGSSLIPCIRTLFERHFDIGKIATGNELTSIAHGLALIGLQTNVADWAVD